MEVDSIGFREESGEVSVVGGVNIVVVDVDGAIGKGGVDTEGFALREDKGAVVDGDPRGGARVVGGCDHGDRTPNKCAIGKQELPVNVIKVGHREIAICSGAGYGRGFEVDIVKGIEGAVPTVRITFQLVRLLWGLISKVRS